MEENKKLSNNNTQKIKKDNNKNEKNSNRRMDKLLKNFDTYCKTEHC